MDSTQSQLEKERLEHASSDEIREDIRGTRRDMDNTLDQLGDRLNPRHLLEEVVDLFRGPRGAEGSDLARTSKRAGRAIADQVKENPVPALMVGAGLVWWMVSSGETDERQAPYRSTYRDLPRTAVDPASPSDAFPATPSTEDTSDADSGPGMMDRAKDGLAASRDRISETGQTLRSGAANQWDTATRGMQRGRREAGKQFNVASERFREARDEHPLALGGIFLAAGICAGLLAPRSAAEDRWMGEASDQLKEEAQTRTKDIANQAAGAALDKAEEKGLTPDNLAEKAGRIVSDAVDAGKAAARDEGLTGEQLKEDLGSVAGSAGGTAQSAGGEHASKVRDEAERSS